ncbi:MAG TPA: hypothetical protein VFZ80_03300, partial [Acidimicrobiia bacterium]
DDLASLPNVYIDAGEVRLNLIPFIGEALRRVADDVRAVLPDFDLPDAISDRLSEGKDQLAAALQASLPEDFGQVTVMSESALAEVQTVAVQLDRLVWATLALTLVLLVLTLVASPNRRKTAIHLGLGVFVAIVIASVAIRRLQEAVVGQIVDPRGSVLAEGLVRDALSGLRAIQLILAVAAVLVAVVAYLAGRPQWFVTLNRTIEEWTETGPDGSRLDRWIAPHTGALLFGGVVIAALAFFLVGLDLLSVVVIGLLLGGYIWAITAASSRGSAGDRVEGPGSETAQKRSNEPV